MTLRTLTTSLRGRAQSRKQTTSPQALTESRAQKVVSQPAGVSQLVAVSRASQPSELSGPTAVSPEGSALPQASADSTLRSFSSKSNRQVARAASPAVSTSSDETAQHGVGVEGVDGVAEPRGCSSRLTHFGSSHHKVEQVVLNKSPRVNIFKNQNLTVVGFMPIMALQRLFSLGFRHSGEGHA